VIRGGYGVFYGQIYDSIPGVDLALGVLNKNHTSVENTLPYASGYPGSQVNNCLPLAACNLRRTLSNFTGNGSTLATGK